MKSFTKITKRSKLFCKALKKIGVIRIFSLISYFDEFSLYFSCWPFCKILILFFFGEKNSSCGNFFHKSTSHNSKMTLPAFALQKKCRQQQLLFFYSWLVAGNFQIKPKWQMADQLPVFSTQKYEIPSPRRNSTHIFSGQK